MRPQKGKYLESYRLSVLGIFLCHSFLCHLKEHYSCSDPIRKWTISKFSMTPHLYFKTCWLLRLQQFGKEEKLFPYLGTRSKENPMWLMSTKRCISFNSSSILYRNSQIIWNRRKNIFFGDQKKTFCFICTGSSCCEKL